MDVVNRKIESTFRIRVVLYLLTIIFLSSVKLFHIDIMLFDINIPREDVRNVKLIIGVYFMSSEILAYIFAKYHRYIKVK